jgi:hypothetical protein
MPVKTRGLRRQTCGHAEGERTGVGEGLVTGGGRAEPPPLRGGARRGLPAARSAPPIRSARGTRRNERASWRARERQRARAPGRRRRARLDPAKLKPRHLRGSGRRPLPEPPPGIVDVSRNLSRAPAASLRDRLRRHLTEPVRQDGGRDRRGLRLAMCLRSGHTERQKAEDRKGKDDGRSAPIHHTVAQD